MTTIRKIAGTAIFIVGLLIPAYAQPLGLNLIISGLVCLLGGFVYVSGMSEEERRLLKSKGWGAWSLRGITLFILLMCVLFVAVFFALLGPIPLIAISFFVALCAIWITLMYLVYFTNR